MATMAVINFVMDAMGTTRSASFTNNSSEVLASTTSAILDLTLNRDGGSWRADGLVGACFEDGGRAEGAVREGEGAAPLCAANPIPDARARSQDVEMLRKAKARAITRKHLQIRPSRGAHDEVKIMSQVKQPAGFGPGRRFY
jgi:hypothetical protein